MTGPSDWLGKRKPQIHEGAAHIAGEASVKADSTNGTNGNGKDHKADSPPPTEAEIDAAIKRLAALPRVKYEMQRQQQAKFLGIRASFLDTLVRAERGEPATKQQGKALEFPEPEPWPDPVDGEELLQDLADFFTRYAFLPSGASTALALWATHTFCYEIWDHTPRLQISAATKNSGKSTVLDLLEMVVNRPLLAAHATTSALFRTIEAAKPTVLLDEVDTYLHDADQTRGILNAGHKRGGGVLRTVGDDNEARSFNCFCPVALAGIGTLPGTLADRAITIRMTRATKDQLPARWTTKDAKAEGAELARRAARWTADNRADLEDARPNLGDMFGRLADNWVAVLSIATVAGGYWPEDARGAAVLLTSTDDEHETLGVKLLADIRQVFTEDTIPSGELVNRLLGLEGRPWPEMGRTRKPLTTNMLARLLKPFVVIPGKVTVGKVTKPDGTEDDVRVSGYALERFTTLFRTYLAPLSDRDSS